MDLYIFSFVLVVLPVQMKMLAPWLIPNGFDFWSYSFKKKKKPTPTLANLSFYKDRNQYKPLAAQVSHPGAELTVTQSKYLAFTYWEKGKWSKLSTLKGADCPASSKL